MNRRDFIKLMGVSTAATAASSVLAKLPEAEPKIQLLEPKKIITDISLSHLHFDRIKRYDARVSENSRLSSVVGRTDVLYHNLGKRDFELNISVYITDEQHQKLLCASDEVNRATFGHPPLEGKLFILSSFTIIAHHSNLPIAEIRAYEILHDGTIKV